MTSQISLSNLLKIDMRSRRWLIILSSVFHFVFGPFAGIMSITTKGNSTLETAIENAFIYEYAIFETAIAIVGAILLSLVGFRFLFSKRMMDLYGSIPVSRNRMFWAVYINNFLIWFIPFVGSIVLTSLFCIVCDSSYAGAILITVVKYFLVGIFTFLMVYNMCLVAVMISGHPFVAIVNMLMMGLAVIAVYGFLYYYASEFFSTFKCFSIPSVNIAWLSPIAAAVYAPGIINEYYLTGIDFRFFIIASILLLVTNLWLANFLFKRRKSELAEGGTKIRAYIIVIRSVVALACGIYLSLMFAIFAIGTVYVWSVVGIAIGVVASFGIINMILYRTGRAFFKDKFIMIGTLVVTIFLFTAFATDIFGYDTYVPDEKYIVKAELQLDEYYDYSRYMTVENGKVIDSDRYGNDEKYAFVTEDKELIHEFLTAGAKNATKQGNTITSIWNELLMDGTYDINCYSDSTCAYAKVYLSNGTYYYRCYHISIHEEALMEIVDSQQFREKNYPLSTGNFEVMPDEISFCKNREYDMLDIDFFDDELIAMIMECYRRDFAEHNVIYTDSEFEGTIDCAYKIYDKSQIGHYDEYGNYEPFSHYNYCNLRYTKDYVRTQLVIGIVMDSNYREAGGVYEDILADIKSSVQEILDEY